MLFISGQNGARSDPVTGKSVIQGDMAAQTEVIYEKIGAILKAAGANFDDIVMTTDYVTSWEDYRETADIRRKYFKDHFPAATGVLVKGLIQGALIEIDAIAVLDASESDLDVAKRRKDAGT
jgi:2-iminobutanoate/2-iminopropanoate deaminase